MNNRHMHVLLLQLLSLILVFGLVTSSRAEDSSSKNDPHAERRTTLTDLPQAAQYTVSAQFGRDDSAYHLDAHAAVPQARNPRQGLTARFGPTEFQVHAGEIEWHLTLAGWGRKEAWQAPSADAAPHLDVNRVEYAHGDLSAWYVNGPLGLQQGWIVRERPAGEGELTLMLRSQGLAAQAETDGRGLNLRDADGKTRLRYGGLLAIDASGRELPARFTVEGEQVRLAVDDTGAAYPLTIDPWVQVAKLTATNGPTTDPLAGYLAISADGNTVVAGAPGSDAGGQDRGAAYVFVRPSGGWSDTATGTAKLTASDGTKFDSLGDAVAISGDGSTIIVGVPYNAAGGYQRGAAYVFVRPASGWVDAIETAKLTASDGADDDYFGKVVAISAEGGTVVAGASGNDVSGYNNGAAYVFVRPAGGWGGDATEIAKLTASDGANSDRLGEAVAISADGSTVAAGAPYRYVSGYNNGAAYVFVRPAGGWGGDATEIAKLTASGGAAYDYLGEAIAISGDGSTVVAGASHNGTGDRGAAYVFVRPAGGWSTITQTARLTASDGANNDYLGGAVAISAEGGTVVAGASFNAAGGSRRGATYVFVRPAGGWANTTSATKLTASDGANYDELGSVVAISADGDTIVAGAPIPGAAYTFVRPAGGWISATETARLTASDGASIDNFGSAVATSADGSTIVAGAPDNDAGGSSRGAAYVFVRSAGSWASATEIAKLTANNGGDYDNLGSSVTISANGDTVVAGAPDNDAGGSRRGAAYVFIRPTGGWANTIETAKLAANNGANYDNLGSSVAISADGSTVVAGAPDNDAGGSSRGAAYVFIRPTGGWANTIETAKFTANDGADYDYLGRAVAISADGSTIVAGAPDNDAGGSSRGAAYVFVQPVGGWATTIETAKLTASDGASYGYLGSAVAISADGGVAIAGAPGRETAYVFNRPAGGWATSTEAAKLTASDDSGYDNLGEAVAISTDGGTVIAGANYHPAISSGDGSSPGPGAVYVFFRPAGGWVGSITETAKLTADDGADDDNLGSAVAISADSNTIITGAPYNAAGVYQNGAVYIFGSTTPSVPTLSINSVSQAEGNSGPTDFTFTVTLSSAASANVTVNWTTADGTATAGSDYTAGSGTLTFSPGELTKTLTVSVNGDTTVEPDETFFVNLSNPSSNATLAQAQGTGTILNDDSPTLSINNVSQAEGNSGTTAFIFTVTLSEAASSTVTVDWAAADGTATAGSDYTAGSGTLTFSPGELTKTLTVPVIGDTTVEPDETFVVNLSNPSNATLAQPQGTGTIRNDDSRLIIYNVSRAEGNSGTTDFTFTLTLTPPPSQTVTVDWATADGTAIAGSDYIAASGTLTFEAIGSMNRTLTVQVIGDTLIEPDETFYVELSNPTNATLGTPRASGRILDDDAPTGHAGVAWSGNRFVRVGAAGTILTSTDGVSWTNAQSIATNDLYGVTWSGQRFVAIGTGGVTLTSPDGIIWTPNIPPFPTTADLSSVIWSGEIFVAIGSGGAILTSPDSDVWTTATTVPATANLFGVTWSGEMFVAVGSGGTLLTSANGNTWTSGSSNTSADLNGIAWSGDQFVAVGANGTLLTSTNGSTWTQSSSGTTEDLFGIAWSGYQFLAVGANGTFLTSPDGLNWQLQGVGDNEALYNVAWSGREFLAVGDGTTQFTLNRPWGDTKLLSSQLWAMIGLPATPGQPGTVQSTLGRSLPDNYESDWVVWRYDEDTDQYVKLLTTDPIVPGVGYWLKKFSADAGTLSLDASLPATEVVTNNDRCPSLAGCYEVALSLPAGAQYRYHLIGMPFPYPVGWWEVRLEVTDLTTGAISLYSLDAAQTAGYLQSTYWVWNGNGYDSHDGLTPGMVGIVQPWQGIWVKVNAAAQGHTLKLLFPRIPKYSHVMPVVPVARTAPPASNDSGFPVLDWLIAPAAADPVESTDPGVIDAHARRTADSQALQEGRAWYLRLIVEEPVRGLRDRNNVLGQLPSAAVGYDRYDLPKLAPFGQPALSVAFPHPDWGAQAGDYASDYRSNQDSQQPGLPPATWRFELRADPADQPLRLRWEGPQAVLDRSELLDEDTGIRYPAHDPILLQEGLSVPNPAPVRHFSWFYSGQTSP